MHAQRIELRSEWRNAVEDEAKQHEPEIAVDGLRAWLIRAWRAQDRSFEGIAALIFEVIRHVRRQSSSV